LQVPLPYPVHAARGVEVDHKKNRTDPLKKRMNLEASSGETKKHPESGVR